ncbi:hypothetical protein ACEQ8H_005739 [Pleosporales sp. CAS-2024a]
MVPVWWFLTTLIKDPFKDFCYVQATDVWQSPEGDYYRMPLCWQFDDGGSGPDDGE